MGKISEIFNFENIGGKIKNLAKWSCWITILLIWIAAPICFIVLVSDRWTVEFCWIPLISAIVGPISVWISSWGIYAFGEFVEDTHAMRNKECSPITKKPVQKPIVKNEPVPSQKATREAKEKTTPHSIKTPDEQTDYELTDDEYIECVCPKCKEKLSFLKDETNAICPWCETKITL